MADYKWWMIRLSHRGAIKVINEIAKLTYTYGMIDVTFYGSDSEMFSMIRIIKQWKRDAEKYHKLRELLNE